MNKIPFIITEDSIAAYFGGQPQHADRSHPNYEKIKEKLQSGDYDGVQELFSIEEAIRSYVSADGTKSGLEIKHGSAYYNGRHLDNALGKKLVEEVERGRPIPHYINFLDKVMQNPSKTAVDELLLFIEAGYMPLAEDGDFLAYKKVRSNFRDIHSGTMDNSPGQVVSMQRNAVDEDRYRTCSYGLHFCSYDYLAHFGSSYEREGGDKVVLLKINPADVVAIPADYRNTKGRTCRYEVLEEVKGWSQKDILASEEFYDSFDSRYRFSDDDEDEPEDWDDYEEEDADDDDYTPFW